MTPRQAIRGIDVTSSGENLLREMAEIGHSHVPVYRDSAEHIIGIIVLKDVIRALAAGETFTPSTLARPPLFVPETARISALLRKFQRGRQELAVVVNEYGGVEGLVTIEEVVEEIVGDLQEDGPGAASL